MSPRGFSHSAFDYRMLSPVLKFLVAANAAAFALCWLAGGQIYDLFGLVPVHVLRDRWVWQPVTYLFLHGNFLHLFFNLFAIWMFALPIESQWGSREFLKYYLLCGVGAGLLSVAVAPHSVHPVIGASGAVYGLLVAFAMLFPDAVVYLYFFFPVKARDMAILFGLIEFFAGATSASPGVARFAHLGGMVIGYLYIRWWWILKIKARGYWHEAVGGRMQRVPPPRRAGKTSAKREASVGESMEEVDRILDKISAYGRDSLSPEEMEVLRRVSERKEGHA